MFGFAALLWLRGEDISVSSHRAVCRVIPHLRDSRQRNADRGKEPDKPSF
jgi:hypothetical protein